MRAASTALAPRPPAATIETAGRAGGSTLPVYVTQDQARAIIEAATTPGAQVAMKITFGQPTVRNQSGLSTVDVEVTNGDTAPHSLLVQATLVQGTQLTGIASGAVNDLAAGQTKTATLLTAGTAPAGVTPTMAVSSVVR